MDDRTLAIIRQWIAGELTEAKAANRLGVRVSQARKLREKAEAEAKNAGGEE